MFEMLWNDEAGLTTVEYALLLALVATVAVAAWANLGTRSEPVVTTATSPLPAN